MRKGQLLASALFFALVAISSSSIGLADDYIISKSENSTIGMSVSDPKMVPEDIDGLYLLANSTNQSFTFTDITVYLNQNDLGPYFEFIIENQTTVVGRANSTNPQSSANINIAQVPFNISNFAVVPRVDYNVSMNVTDAYGNWSKFFVRYVRFIESPQSFEKITYTTNSSNIASFNKSDTVNVSLDIKFSQFAAGDIVVALYDHNPEGANATASALGKFIDIEGDTNVSLNMAWTNLRIHYTASDLVEEAIVNESAMGLYYWNEDTQQWEAANQTYTDAENNFVYANLTHFSTYGVFENIPVSSPSPTPSPASPSSGSGGGGSKKKKAVASQAELGGSGGLLTEAEIALISKRNAIDSIFEKWLLSDDTRIVFKSEPIFSFSKDSDAYKQMLDLHYKWYMNRYGAI